MPGRFRDPTGFEAVVRVLHPAGDDRTWAQVAAEAGRVLHPLVQWPCIASHLTAVAAAATSTPQEGSIPLETLEASLDHCASEGFPEQRPNFRC